MQGLEREDLEDKKIERALEKIGRFAHWISVTEWRVTFLLSVSKGKVEPLFRAGSCCLP
jgi:hypothetical protein